MPEEKRKARTSTEVKRRYNEKTYTLISASIPKETAAAFKAECAAQQKYRTIRRVHMGALKAAAP